jgi:hypothetical protein
MRLTVRGSLVAAGAVILLALTGIGGLLIVQAITPHISVEEATAAAISQIQQMNTGSSGYTLVSARYDPAPDIVHDDLGNLIYSASRSLCLIGGIRVPSFLCHAEAAWILHLRAPAQGGYRSYDAYVVVNATTGRVRSASVSGT